MYKKASRFYKGLSRAGKKITSQPSSLTSDVLPAVGRKQSQLARRLDQAAATRIEEGKKRYAATGSEWKLIKGPPRKNDF